MIFEVYCKDIGFTEGPVLLQNGSALVTSIDGARLYTIDREGGVTSVDTGGGPNGATEGRNGVVYVAQNGGYRPFVRHGGSTGGVQAVQPDGAVSWVTT